MESVTTTFDADSGAGQADPRICNLTATTGLVIGRSYHATNALGESERVEVGGISSGAYVQARKPLQNAYVAADTFVSTRITHAIDSTWVADQSNISGEFDPNPRYRWRLVYVVGGVTRVHDAYFDLLRYPARHTVEPGDVDRRAPGWIERLPQDYREDQGRSLIDEAYRLIKFDLYNLAIPDQALRNREVVDELVIAQAVAMVDTTEANAKRYEARLAQIVAMGKVNVSTDASGAGTRAEVVSAWSK